MLTVKCGGMHLPLAMYVESLRVLTVIIAHLPPQDVGVAGGSSRTFARPVPLTIGNATNVVVENIVQIGSPNWVRRVSSLYYRLLIIFTEQRKDILFSSQNLPDRATSFSSSTKAPT